MQIIYNTSLATFNEAVDNFFSWNPKNPYWFLLVMYLRKEGSLAIVNDYAGNKSNIIAPVADKTYWETLDHKGEWPKNANTISIIGNIANNERLMQIFGVFQKETEKKANERDKYNAFTRPQWEASFLLETAQSLISIDDEWFNENFESLFNKVIYRIFAKEKSLSFSSNSEVDEIVKALIGPDVRTVYNPFAGNANLASCLVGSDITYIGEETNKIDEAIGNLRLISSNIEGEVKNIAPCHVLTYGADIIISALHAYSYSYHPSGYVAYPMGDDSDEDLDRIKKINETRNDYFTFLIRKCVLTETRGIIIVPDVLNFKTGIYETLRRDLVQQDCVDMVISLSSPLFSNSVVPLAIYVINKNHNHKGNIRFVNICDADKDCDLLLSSLWGNSPMDSRISKLVSHEDIMENNCLFAPEAYVFPQIEDVDVNMLKPISELGRFLTFNRVQIAQGRFLSNQILRQENKVRIIRAHEVDIQETESRRVVEINKPCVMITPMTRSVINLDPQGEILYVDHRGQIFFEPKSDVILPQYFALQLSEEYAKKQLGDRPLQTGSSSFMRSIFHSVKLFVPSIEEQQKAIDYYQLNLIGALGMEINSLKNQRFNEYERNMHLRKHALKQVMNEVLPAARRITKFISSQEDDFSKKSIIAERSQSTLEDYVVKLFNNVEKVNALITALTEETRFNSPEIIEIDTFITNYKRSKLADNYDLEYFGHNSLLDDIVPDISDEPLIAVTDQGNPVFILPSPITVYIARDCLTTVFDNIIANAVKHGFTKPERKDYAIRIEFRNTVIDDRDMVEFIVANNGEKLPVGMSADRMFTWGVGSGTGLGSWQIKNIIEHFGGSIKFIQYDDKADGFNIEYRFTIPMKDE